MDPQSAFLPEEPCFFESDTATRRFDSLNHLHYSLVLSPSTAVVSLVEEAWKEKNFVHEKSVSLYPPPSIRGKRKAFVVRANSQPIVVFSQNAGHSGVEIG